MLKAEKEIRIFAYHTCDHNGPQLDIACDTQGGAVLLIQAYRSFSTSR